MPGFGALVTNCGLDRRMAKGLHRWPTVARRWLHVSAGLGTHPTAPVRFACRPEASILTLSRADRPAPRGSTAVCDRRRSASIGRRTIGVWRSLVARFVRDEEAVGSNPATPTSKNRRSRPLLGGVLILFG